MEPASAEFHLPIEVWRKVFQHSEATDALNFRLVCSAWRIELDEHFDKWIVRLDLNSPYFQSLLELKVKEATVLNLSTLVDFGQEDTPRLFQHPELLEKLSIPKGSEICLENLMLLLKSCRKTIKHLDLAVGHVDEEDEIIATANNLYPNGLEFTNLESLTLAFPGPRRIQEVFLFKVIVGRSRMSNIKSLTIYVPDRFSYNLQFSTILAFIAKNGRNLEEIKCYLIARSEVELPTNSIVLALLRQVQRLQRVEMAYLPFLGFDNFTFNETLRIACETLLEAQRNLTHLYLNGIQISRQSLRRVCYNNKNTLTTIELRELDYNINLVILAGCLHVKELLLEGKNLPQAWPVFQNSRSLIPVGIQKFESKNYFIESEDILKLFTGHGGLENIILYNSGLDGSYGVTAAVFAALVFNPNLRNKLTSVDIREFNWSTAGDLAVLNYILRSLEPTWEDKQDFEFMDVSMRRTMGEGGDSSVWKLEAFIDY